MLLCIRLHMDFTVVAALVYLFMKNFHLVKHYLDAFPRNGDFPRSNGDNFFYSKYQKASIFNGCILKLNRNHFKVLLMTNQTYSNSIAALPAV